MLRQKTNLFTQQIGLSDIRRISFWSMERKCKKLFEDPDEEADIDFDQEKYKKDEADNAITKLFYPSHQILFIPLRTPFRAINSGEFIEDQIYNWSYSDEQNAKSKWIDQATHI